MLEVRRPTEPSEIVSQEVVISAVIPLYHEHMRPRLPTKSPQPFAVANGRNLKGIIETHLSDVECLILVKKIVGELRYRGYGLRFSSEEFQTDEHVYVDPLVIDRAQAQELQKIPGHGELLALDDIVGTLDYLRTESMVFTKSGWIRALRSGDSTIYTTSGGVQIEPYRDGSLVDYITVRKGLLEQRAARNQAG